MPVRSTLDIIPFGHNNNGTQAIVKLVECKGTHKRVFKMGNHKTKDERRRHTHKRALKEIASEYIDSMYRTIIKRNL